MRVPDFTVLSPPQIDSLFKAVFSVNGSKIVLSPQLITRNPVNKTTA